LIAPRRLNAKSQGLMNAMFGNEGFEDCSSRHVLVMMKTKIASEKTLPAQALLVR
jgi:hypothetical protein